MRLISFFCFIFICLFIDAQRTFCLPKFVVEQDENGNTITQREYQMAYRLNPVTRFYENMVDKAIESTESIYDLNCYFYEESTNSVYFYDKLSMGKLVLYNKKQIKALKTYIKDNSFESGKVINAKLKKEIENNIQTYIQKQNTETKLLIIREQYVADSIAKAKAKAQKDSIAKAEQERKEREQKEKLEREKKEYIAAHPYIKLPVRGSYLYPLKCQWCDTEINSSDTLIIADLTTDTIYSMNLEEKDLELTRLVFHSFPITSELRKYEPFQKHVIFYSDSICSGRHSIDGEEESCSEHYASLNNASLRKYIQGLLQKAPFGYIKDYNWNDEYSMVTFDVSFVNLNKKTIKYADFYFQIKNAVGDVRLNGNFKGTGPVEYLDTGTWEWDSSHYFVAGDASTLRITKVILTYMDGTQKILTGNLLQIN